jgi:hypothetical protein
MRFAMKSFKIFLMRNWTTKEIFILKRALQRGLRPEEIAQLLPRHSVRGIIARTCKQQDGKSLPEFLRLRRASSSHD